MKRSETKSSLAQPRAPRSDREASQRQLDLFAERGGVEPRHSPPTAASSAPAPAVDTLSDDDLLELIPNTGPSNVEAVCSEVVSRSLQAAVALGLRGDSRARQPLFDELERSPSTEIIEAVATVWDDDTIVRLGRCARRHPRLAGAVLDALREIGGERAEVVAKDVERHHSQ